MAGHGLMKYCREEKMSKSLSQDYIGSLSQATMRIEDLIPTFLDFLEGVKVNCQIIGKVHELKREIDSLEVIESDYGSHYSDLEFDADGPCMSDAETASYILNEDIWELLNDISPEHATFGSHPGDGANYGFWQYEIECAKYDPESECDTCGWECPECDMEFDD